MINHRFAWMKIVVLALAATLLCALPTLASFPEQVARDLGAKTATLVAPAGSEWLIDLDATAGIQTGDLFTVMTKGAPVIHPVSKQVIGTLDEVRAILRVTSIKSGYSYASVISTQGALKAGDEARRFAGLPAHFWDYTGEGEGVFTQLQSALPELQWQSYVAAQAQRPEPPRPVEGMAPGLVFVLNAQGLGIKDHQFQPLRFYRPEVVGRGPAPTATAAAPAVVAPLAAAVATPAPTGGSIVAPGGQAAAVPGSSAPGLFGGLFGGGSSAQPGAGGVLPGSGQSSRGGLIVSQMDNKEGVWYGPRLDGHPVGLDVADLTGDGKQEIALAFKDRVVVARVVAGQYEVVTEYPFGQGGNALSLDALDLDGDGRAELYVSMVQMNSVSSQVLELRDGKFDVAIRNIPFFLRKVTLPGEGAVLLGQELNADLLNHNQDLTGTIFRVSRSGDKLQRGAAVDLPQEVSLFGFQPFEHGGRPLLARLNINDKLQVLESSGATLWESSDYFGGSETSFERSSGLADGSTRYAFLPPRLEPGPDGTVLVPVNEGSRTFSAFRAFNSSHLKAVAFDGYSLVERWRTKPQGGYLGDFRMADADNDGVAEIVMLVMFSRGGMLKGSYGNSALLIYEMQ